MSAALQGISIEAFLAWDGQQDTSYEFYGQEVRATVGGSCAHARIQVRLLALLDGKLRDSGCEVVGSESKLRIADRIRYPDAFITCSPIQNTDQTHSNPVVIFEIVSPSSERIDRFIKNVEYRQLSSLKAYVLLQQDFIGAEMFLLEDLKWSGHVFGPGSILPLPGLGIDLELDQVYRGIVSE
jgi:Uma2 family endonuclease